MNDRIFQVLIADRNPNVLEFLRREFLRDGYRVLLAKDGYDLCNYLRAKELPDLIVLDPDLPYIEECGTLATLERTHVDLPLILHTLAGTGVDHLLTDRAKALVEKGGDPARLKLKVREILVGQDSKIASDRPGPPAAT